MKRQQQLLSVFQQMARRRAASKDGCPLELKSLRTDEDTSVSSLDRDAPTKSSSEDQPEEDGAPGPGAHVTGSLTRGDEGGGEVREPSSPLQSYHDNS